MSKTMFCPHFVGVFKWVVMTFELKNTATTYQRAINFIFHDLLGVVMEIRIDDVVIKSAKQNSHLDDLRRVFVRMCRYGFKNPLICAFGVLVVKFLGSLLI